MTFRPVTSITLACTRTANLLFFLCLMVLSAGRNYQYPDLPVPEHKNTFQSTPLSSLTVTYRWAVEYTYLLRRPVSTGSNKQATANTQITAWVSLWLTLLTSWFVFTLVLKNYRKCEICLVKNSLLFTGVLLWPTTSLCQCKFQVKSAHRIKNKTTLNKSKLKVPIQRQLNAKNK